MHHIVDIHSVEVDTEAVATSSSARRRPSVAERRPTVPQPKDEEAPAGLHRVESAWLAFARDVVLADHHTAACVNGGAAASNRGETRACAGPASSAPGTVPAVSSSSATSTGIPLPTASLPGCQRSSSKRPTACALTRSGAPASTSSTPVGRTCGA